MGELAVAAAGDSERLISEVGGAAGSAALVSDDDDDDDDENEDEPSFLASLVVDETAVDSFAGGDSIGFALLGGGASSVVAPVAVAPPDGIAAPLFSARIASSSLMCDSAST